MYSKIPLLRPLLGLHKYTCIRLLNGCFHTGPVTGQRSVVLVYWPEAKNEGLIEILQAVGCHIL